MWGQKQTSYDDISALHKCSFAPLVRGKSLKRLKRFGISNLCRENLLS